MQKKVMHELPSRFHSGQKFLFILDLEKGTFFSIDYYKIRSGQLFYSQYKLSVWMALQYCVVMTFHDFQKEGCDADPVQGAAYLKELYEASAKKVGGSGMCDNVQST